MIALMMYKKTKARLFVSNTLEATAEITATSDQAHYLLRVLRVKNGDYINLFNGCDGEWTSVIKDVSKKRLSLSSRKKIKGTAY